MKKLRKIRLINWHRFTNETIELADSVLLSGENGAGKSTLLDAIQFVVTCSKTHFNKAAHEKGKRNLNSYVRCKTGQEDHPYERTGAISSHIALEFYDEARKCPFIVGSVLDSASEEKEPNAVWYLMENQTLRDDLFLQGNRVKSISVFRATNKKIRTFAKTQTEARSMMLSRFGRLEDKFFSLIPKALAFKPIHDIKDFVYSYVLDEKEVNIDALKENVRSYQDLERMLEDVKRRILALEKINEKETEIERYMRNDRNHAYYLARADVDLTKEAQADAEARKQYAILKREELGRQKRTLKKSHEEGQETITNLRVELNGDEAYQALHELERRRDHLKEEIAQDKEAVRALQGAARHALSEARRLWQAGGDKLPHGGGEKSRQEAQTIRTLLQSDSGIRYVEDYIAQLEKLETACKSTSRSTAVNDVSKTQPEKTRLSGQSDDGLALTSVRLCLEKVVSYKKDASKKVHKMLAENEVRLCSRQEELRELHTRIVQLEKKQLTYAKEVTLLAGQIREQFHRSGRTGEVRVLCELLEITNPAWQNAVEGYLNNQRFYLLVEPEDFDLALSVYDKMRENKKAYGVGLINTGKLERYDEAPEGSLAEMVSSKSIWARRYVNMVLGRVHCCKSYQELKQHAIAITRQCMRYQNHVVSAIRPEVYRTPYIGKEAYLRQLEQCRVREQALTEEIAAMERLRDQLTAVEVPLDDAADIDVKFRLAALEEKRTHDMQLAKCEEQIQKLEKNQTLILKRMHLDELETRQNELLNQISDIDNRIGQFQKEEEQQEKELAALSVCLLERQAVLTQTTERLGADAAGCEREYEKQTAGRALARFKENFERARKANATQREHAEAAMISLMREYKTAHDFGAAESAAGYPEFLAEYDKLKNSQLLTYEEKVQKARQAAEEEFREQFLSRLQENIKQAQNEFKELNKSLKDIHFSRERYEFLYEPNKRLKKYYRMIMDDFNVMGGESIFSGVFRETHREVIDELFEKLTLEDENSAKTLEEYTDYRTYMDYDMKIAHADGGYMLYSKVSQEKSGGETQTPFYITVAASFMQLYRNSIGGDAIGLVMFDEAFNNMDDERISGMLEFLTSANLQVVIAAPPDKIQYIGPAVKKVLLVLQENKSSYVEEFGWA